MASISDYPAIKKTVIHIAVCNGMINRMEPEEKVLAKAEEVLFADGVVTQDLKLLEDWLGTLDRAEFDIYTDGEHTEREQVEASAPPGVEGRRVTTLIDDIFPI